MGSGVLSIEKACFQIVGFTVCPNHKINKDGDDSLSSRHRSAGNGYDKFKKKKSGRTVNYWKT